MAIDREIPNQKDVDMIAFIVYSKIVERKT